MGIGIAAVKHAFAKESYVAIKVNSLVPLILCVCVCVLCSQCSQKIIKLNVDKFIGGKSSIHKTPKLAPRPA